MVLLEFLRINLIQFHLSYLSPQNYVLHMHLYSKTFFPSSSFFLPRIYIYSGYNYFSRDLVFRTLFLWLLASRYTWICQGHSKNGILGGGCINKSTRSSLSANSSKFISSLTGPKYTIHLPSWTVSIYSLVLPDLRTSTDLNFRIQETIWCRKIGS